MASLTRVGELVVATVSDTKTTWKTPWRTAESTLKTENITADRSTWRSRVSIDILNMEQLRIDQASQRRSILKAKGMLLPSDDINVHLLSLQYMCSGSGLPVQLPLIKTLI